MNEYEQGRQAAFKEVLAKLAEVQAECERNHDEDRSDGIWEAIQAVRELTVNP